MNTIQNSQLGSAFSSHHLREKAAEDSPKAPSKLDFCNPPWVDRGTSCAHGLKIDNSSKCILHKCGSIGPVPAFSGPWPCLVSAAFGPVVHTLNEEDAHTFSEPTACCYLSGGRQGNPKFFQLISQRLPSSLTF